MILNSSWLQLNGHFWNQASMGIEGEGYDWPPMASALDLKGQLANMNRGALCGTGGYKGNGGGILVIMVMSVIL